jgi:hypothetical protein
MRLFNPTREGFGLGRLVFGGWSWEVHFWFIWSWKVHHWRLFGVGKFIFGGYLELGNLSLEVGRRKSIFGSQFWGMGVGRRELIFENWSLEGDLWKLIFENWFLEVGLWKSVPESLGLSLGLKIDSRWESVEVTSYKTTWNKNLSFSLPESHVEVI